MPISLGGLAAPDMGAYFLGSLLTAVQRWLNPLSEDPITMLKPIWYFHRIYLPSNLTTVPEPQLWAKFNVKYLGDIYKDNFLLSFQQIKDNFNVPNKLFRYLQLRHAINQQFRSGSPIIEVTPLEKLLRKEKLTKPLSAIYHQIGSCTQIPIGDLYNKWITNIPDLTTNQWETILAESIQPLIRSRDRLIQFKYLHRAYYTPHILHRINPTFPDVCNKCMHLSANGFTD
ncbi:hypothetical protein XELAEV_18041847mg [Xenopus laevis]|uniref:Uncharacterized protein n=1 Tax=Xenopus laevis TaxID=8355 RepID=A0A974C2T2_XENLA|nr:hypothetical protein XELAEV_18041847mg [Xenopus laevis]